MLYLIKTSIEGQEIGADTKLSGFLIAVYIGKTKKRATELGSLALDCFNNGDLMSGRDYSLSTATEIKRLRIAVAEIKSSA